MSVDPKQLATEALALKAAGRLPEAIALQRRVVALQPNSAVAEHNLASTLGRAGRWRDAEPHIRAAFTKGGDAAESWLVLGRCVQSLGRHDDAEQAFKEALKRKPQLYEAHTDLAQLRWMRTGDIAAALADLESAIRATAGDTRLLVAKAKVLEQCGQLEAAYALLAALAAVHTGDLAIVTTASQYALELGKADEALKFAQRAAQLAPREPIVAVALIAAHLGAGQADAAAARVAELRQWSPKDQYAIALQAAAWRMLGDARYRTLYDYDTLVFPTELDTPRGWPSLSAYLADVAEALKAIHGFTEHPFHQSIRHGSQAPDILHQEHPALAAFPQALEAPINSYLAAIGQGPDPIRARNTGRYDFQGMWSIRMKAGGFHIDHVHPLGWISSACYIEVPATLRGNEGWLKFGEPGMRTTPALAPEHFVEPAPGKLVLFPSYMWHGTVPFTDTGARMTIAFDLTPA